MRGTATVVTNTGGSSELVQDGISGFTVPPGDADALAQALIWVLSNRQLAERMGEAGRHRALVEFSEDRVIERFIGLYQSLIQTKHPPIDRGISCSSKTSTNDRAISTDAVL